MNKNILSILIILACIIASTSAGGCEVANSSPVCNFTVLCHEKTTELKLPKCSEEPNVTLVVMNSVENLLDSYFFRVFDFRFRVNEIIAIDNTWTTLKGMAFSYFENAAHLDLSYNKIQHVEGGAFIRLAQMTFLNLSGNIIESLEFGSFELYKDKIQEIDVSHNRLKKVDGEFRFVRGLKTLHLQHNQLTNLADNAFDYVTNLTYLNLQNNLLTYVSPSFKDLKGLTTLNLSYNRLTTLSANDVKYLVSLVDFDISHNQLKSVEYNCFSEAQHLQKADFSFNDIEMVIGENMFINNTELQHLNFYHNKITEVHPNAFKNCDLHYLNFDGNHILGDVPKIVSKAQNETKSISPKNVSDVQISKLDDADEYKSSDVSRTPVTNTTRLSTSDELNLLEKEIQDIRLQLDGLNSLVNNLTVILETYSGKIGQ